MGRKHVRTYGTMYYGINRQHGRASTTNSGNGTWMRDVLIFPKNTKYPGFSSSSPRSCLFNLVHAYVMIVGLVVAYAMSRVELVPRYYT